MNDALGLLLRLNLAASAAVLLVVLLRRPARRLFGAGVAYGLWLLVPLAAAAILAPPRVVTLAEPALTAHAAPIGTWSAAIGKAVSPEVALPALPLVLAALWLAGALYALARLVSRQQAFARAVRAGTAGPAVVGVLRPRIITPDDFAQRYTARERELVLAHEGVHLARQDSRVNALVALARCLAWFNPFAHALGHCLRIDQELACDAQVVARHPTARRAYAEAMLKTQLALKPLPLGCYWPADGAHPLAQRIALLARPAPGRRIRALGALSVAGAALAVGWAAWAARPVEFVWAPAPVAPTTLPAAAPMAAALALPPSPVSPPMPATPRLAANLPIPADPEPPPQPPPGAAPVVPAMTPIPADGCGEPMHGDGPRRLAPGDFGPARRIHSAARWSSVEPGTAVRVYATAADPDGVPLVTDLTAFGSQSWYRVGCIRRSPSPEKLFTSVEQHGGRFIVMAWIQRPGGRLGRALVELASGEAGDITLAEGRTVHVVAIARRETPEEAAAARTTGELRFVNVARFLADT